jgi:hypothetical protein
MKTKLYVIICLSVLLSFLACRGYGQGDFRPGYIISKSDTIHGLIEFRTNGLNSGKCEFKKDANANVEVYSPFDIDSYVLADNRFYVSKTILLKGEEKQVFLEYLINGIVDLYYFSEGVEEFYFIDKNDELIQLNNDAAVIEGENGKKYLKYSNQYKGVLAGLFSDAPGLFIQLSNAKFELNSLVKLTKEYHNMVCDDYACIDYTKLRKRDIFCEVDAGMILSYMGLTTSSDHVSNVEPVFGLYLRVFDTRYNSRFSLMTGLNYSKNSFGGEFENYLFTDRQKFYYIELDYSMIRLPITLEYSLLPGKLQPTISLTAQNGFLLKSGYALEIRNYITEGNYSAVKTESPLRKYQFGVMLGAGLRYKINRNSYLNCGVNYEYRIPSANFNYILDYLNFNSFIFSVGYGYRIR